METSDCFSIPKYLLILLKKTARQLIAKNQQKNMRVNILIPNRVICFSEIIHFISNETWIESDLLKKKKLSHVF